MVSVFEAVYEMLESYASTNEVEVPPSPKEQAEKVFLEMDTNQDGQVTFDEFVAWCNKDPRRLESILIFDTVV